MLISLNWIRDFVDLPTDLDPQALAERFTMTTAEIEGVEPIEVAAQGLIAAEVRRVEPIPNTRNLHLAVVGVGNETAETITAAPNLAVGVRVVFAPPGATLSTVGRIEVARIAGRSSTGMILPGEALGLDQSVGQAVLLPPSTPAGQPIHTAGLLDDWVIEIDNKSITHRPDLWGHYGVARELAAIYDRPLKPYPFTPIDELSPPGLPVIPIVIDEPDRCPRYSGLLMRGLRAQASPLWMQVRLSHVGIRPIDFLVDLTNYVMAELGQPMHAFDGDKVERIEIATAKRGQRFVTLDGMERELPPETLMICCNRKPVALAGIMGGAETEVTAATTSVLLESANFSAAVIRRAAAAMGHRTEASARFEKSQDPHNTVVGIARFVHLARAELPELQLASQLSDCFPHPPEPITVSVDRVFVGRFMGRHVSDQQITRILERIGFTVDTGAETIEVRVPTWRATKDISIEADVIEEIARFVGYDNITPVLPSVAVRDFELNPLHQLERSSLAAFCLGQGFCELHSYVWYDDDWMRMLGYEPPANLQLRNPQASTTSRLRDSLLPGLLRAVDRNRHHLEHFKLVEIGSVFGPGPRGADAGFHYQSVADHEERHLALAVAGRATPQDVWRLLESALQVWSEQVLARAVYFHAAGESPRGPWEDPLRTAEVVVDGTAVGRLTLVPLECRNRIDEHLRNWAIALAYVVLNPLATRRTLKQNLVPVPTFPGTALDFSVMFDGRRQYADLAEQLRRFDHPVLRRLSLVGQYEGEPLPPGKRSLTLRVHLGLPDRTLTDSDLQSFRAAFCEHLKQCQLEIRS